MLKRIDRYLLREILGPLALGLLVYTLILLVQQFFSFADWIIKRGIPASQVGRLLLYSLPSIVVLTLPMALLLGVLLGVGRLASDSELVALRAAGVSIFRLTRPVVLISVALAALNVWLMLELKPRGNAAFSRLLLDASMKSLGAQFEPRVFYNEFQGKVLYVFDGAPRGGDWQGVFLADAVPLGDRPSDVIAARTGRLELEDGGERVVLRLEDAVQHTYDAARPDRYETRRYEKLRLVLREQFASGERQRLMAKRSTRNLGWSELGAMAADPKESAEQRNLARVERQKMLSIPAACLVLGLLALPLAFNNRRGGKSSGFALSIGIVIAYHVMITQGEEAARLGKLAPMPAMWLPNVVLAALALVLLAARNRDRAPVPAFLRRSLSRGAVALGRGLSRLGRSPRRTRGAVVTGTGASIVRSGLESVRGTARVLLRVPRLRPRFPNLLDRYVLRRFAFVFGLVLLSTLTLRMIADFTENVDDILRHDPPAATVVRYYKYQALQMAFDIAPLAVLVTTLVTFSLLARTNEITASKSLGVSLYRLAVPALVGAGVIALGATFLQAQVLPASNQKVAEAKDRIKGRPNQRTVRSADRQWLLGQGRFMYNYLSFDERRATLRGLHVFEFDREHRLVARLYAEEARHDARGWIATAGWTRTFAEREQLDYAPFPGAVSIDLPEDPSYFASEVRRPSQMTFGELSGYVAELRASGQPQPKYEVALYNKLAFPVAAVVMAMVGLPFAFRLERRGALYGLGVSVILGMVFLAVYAFFSTLGEVGALPAVVAVWSPSVVFSLLSAYLFLGVRS